MDQAREVLRYYNYALKTEQVYCQWILRNIRLHGGNAKAALWTVSTFNLNH